MDPDSVPIPPLYLCVEKFAENTTPGNLWKLLFINNVEGADDLDILKNKNQKPYAAIVTFRNAESASKAVNKLTLNGSDIEVSPFVHREWIIGGKEGYKQFIKGLRKLLARRKDGIPEYIVEGKDGQPSANPVLGKQQGGKQPERWIHIKLSIAKKKGIEEESTTTLVIRDDNLYVKGFTGKDGRWFELCEESREKDEEKLPKEYNATKLEGWGFMYANLMKLNDTDQVKETLKSTMLGEAFAQRAVLRLSRYCPEGVENNDDIPVRLGLAGLIVMICEAARLNPLLNHFAGLKQGLDPKVADFIWN